jgi:AcrR family transcriptional regulator
MNPERTGFPHPPGGLFSEDLPHLKGMGRRQRRAAETRLRLFRCALQLFAERGFPNVTVEDITEAADVGKGTFFNYFDGKDHVLGVMAEIQLGKVQEALEQATIGKRSVQSVLRRLFERIAEEPGRSPDLARAFISSFLGSEVVRRHLDRNMADGRGMIAQIVELGQKRGEIDPKLKTDQVSLLLQQTLMGTLLLWSLRGEPGLQNAVGGGFQHFWRAVAVLDRAGRP